MGEWCGGCVGARREGGVRRVGLGWVHIVGAVLVGLGWVQGVEVVGMGAWCGGCVGRVGQGLVHGVGVVLGGWGWNRCSSIGVILGGWGCGGDAGRVGLGWVGWCWGKVGLGWVYSVGVVLGDSGAGLGAQCGALPFCPY